MNTPRVAIIIPTKDNYELLMACHSSILANTGYGDYTILVADTGSADSTYARMARSLKGHARTRLIRYDYYNFARINNHVVKNHAADSDLLLFCNDDIELRSDPVSEMVDYYVRHPSVVGTMGVKLLYPDDSIQHAGIVPILQGDRFLGLYHRLYRQPDQSLKAVDEVWGNTGAFLMIARDLFSDLGRFNEGYQECLEDVELNLEALLAGRTNVLFSRHKVIHHESISRGKNAERREREEEDYNGRFLPFLRTNIDRLEVERFDYADDYRVETER